MINNAAPRRAHIRVPLYNGDLIPLTKDADLPMPFLDARAMQAFAADMFQQRKPYPWFSFEQLLTPEGFQTLLRDFPSLALFEEHRGVQRADHQRPHDRYYLAFERSLYKKDAPESGGDMGHGAEDEMAGLARNDDEMAGGGGATGRDGIVGLKDIPTTWQQFIEELRESAVYRSFTERLLDSGPMTVRFAWHVGFSGSEVSPHRDTDKKIGTHIFYFNTSEDWRKEWGGAILVLGDKRIKRKNPEVSDFGTTTAAEILDNRSFLFKNTPDAWHGVEPLTCPPGKHRRLFNVIFEHAGAPPRRRRGLLGLFRSR